MYCFPVTWCFRCLDLVHCRGFFFPLTLSIPAHGREVGTVWSSMSLPNQNSPMILWLSFCVGTRHIIHPFFAFGGGGLLCTLLELLWTCLRLSTGWLEHVLLNGKSVQSCVLSWTSPGSLVADKNTGIGNQFLREKPPFTSTPPQKQYPEDHQMHKNGKLGRLHCRTGTIKLFFFFPLQI